MRRAAHPQPNPREAGNQVPPYRRVRTLIVTRMTSALSNQGVSPLPFPAASAAVKKQAWFRAREG
jgi:hypothetical protein